MQNIHAIVSQAQHVGMVQIESEVMLLAGFLAAYQPQHVLEIGTDRGGLFYLLTQLSSGLKISIDLPGGAYSSVTSDSAHSRDTVMQAWDPKVRLIRGDSHLDSTEHQFRKILEEPLDLLFIDGDHSLKGVTEDIVRYSKYVRQGGWIGFHDINDTPQHRSAGVLVSELWNKLQGRKLEFNSRSTWAGIGLIQAPVQLEP